MNHYFPAGYEIEHGHLLKHKLTNPELRQKKNCSIKKLKEKILASEFLEEEQD